MNTIIPFSVSSSIDKAATLKIACVPIGHISQAKFEQRVSTIEKLAQELDHSRITDANSPSSSPFTSFNQPTARLEVTVLTLPSNVFSESLDDRYDLFISLIQNSEWDEYLPLNHVFAVLGIADGETSESMEECYQQYAALKTALPSNQSSLPTSASFALTSAPTVSAPKLPFRCQFFAFGFDYDGLGYDDAITVPLDSDDRALSYASACLHGLVSNLMHDAECWVGDVIKSEQTLVLKSPLDLGAINQSMLPSSSSPLNALESITAKVRKQRIGRQQKAIGDLCLVFGCPSDALIHIRQAVDCLKSCNDSPWLASVYESQAAALFASEKRGSAEVFNESILQLLTDSAGIYAGLPGAAALCIASSFKLARYLAMHTRVTEAIDLLMRTNELPLDLSAHHQVELAVNAGKLAAEMGAMRKFAFLIVQASAVYEELHQYVAAIRMLRFAMPVYGLDELNRSLEYGSDVARSTDDEAEAKSIQCRWPGIQRTLLEHFVYNCVKCDDYLSAIQATILLQKCVAEHELLDADAQNQLNLSLLHLTATLPVDLLVRDCGIPVVNFIRPVSAHPDRQPIRSTWHDQDCEQVTNNDVFLFNPADSKSGQSGSSPCLTFSAKDPIVFEVSLDNPLSVVCEVQKLTLSGLGCGFRSHCTGFFVAPRSKDQRFLVTCTTDYAGVLQITGCHLQCFSMTQVVDVDQFGFNITTLSAAKLAKEYVSLSRVDNMEILDPLPLLLVSVNKNNNMLLDGQSLFENESVSGYVQLTNDGSVDVEQAELKMLPLFAALSAQSQAAYYSQAELEAEQALRVRRKSSSAILERPSASSLSFDSDMLSSCLPLRVGQSVKLPFRMTSSSGLIGLQLSLTYSSQKSAHYCRRLERKVSWLTTPVAEIKQVQVQSVDTQTTAMVVLVENFSNFEVCIMLQVDGIETGLLSSQSVQGCQQTRLIFTLSRFDPSLVDPSFSTGGQPVTVERICASIMRRLHFSWSTVRGIVRHGQLPVLWRCSQEQVRALIKPFARITCDIPGRCCTPSQDCEWVSISSQPSVSLGEPIEIRINVLSLGSPAILLFECLDADVLISGSPNIELESADDQRDVKHVITVVILSPGKHNFAVFVKHAGKLSESIYTSKALFSLTGV